MTIRVLKVHQLSNDFFGEKLGVILTSNELTLNVDYRLEG